MFNFVKKIKQKISLISALYRYDGAIPSYARPFNWWKPQDAHLDIDNITRETLVERSRELERNNAYWAKFLDIHENYTVGRGIPVTPASSDPEFNKFISDKFNEWSQHPMIDSDLSLSEAERTFGRAGACDGESFIVKVSDGVERKIQVVECQRVGSPSDLHEGNDDIIDGIKVDALGKPLSYFVRLTRNGQYLDRYQEMPAWQVIHIFNPSRFGQMRGLPLCTNVINDLIDLDILHKYEMDAAKFNSQRMAVFSRQGDDINDSIDSPFHKNTDTQSVEVRRQNIEKSFGGIVFGVNPGENLTPYISNRPSVITQDYWEFLLKKISAGIGYSDLLIFPRSVQGSIVRANLETTAARLRAEYEIYASAVKEIFKWFAEGYSYRTTATDWWKCTTQPPRSPIVDIERNSNAIIEETRNGMRSLTSNCAELGRPIEDVLNEKARECVLIKEAAKKAGITEQELLSSMTGIFSGNLPIDSNSYQGKSFNKGQKNEQ